jgi:AAA domain
LKFDDIRLLIVAAFRFTHSLAENDNDDMSEVMRLWNEAARRAHCVILLLHHFKKGRDRGVDQARGAASITDHARAALPLSIMLKGEAEQFDLPDHDSRYVRLDDPKLNFQAKPQDAVWFHLAEVELANGDKVPVAERWYPSPSTRAPVPLSNELAALIERGPGEGDYYTKDRKSADRWFGKAVMEHMDVDADKAAKLIAQWLKQGQLVETDYISPRRRGKQQRLCLPAQ